MEAPHIPTGRRAALGRERHRISAPLLTPALKGVFSQPESGQAASSGQSQLSQSLLRAIKAPPVSSFTSERQGQALAKCRRNGNKTIMRASPSTRGAQRGGPGEKTSTLQVKSSFHQRGQAGRLHRHDGGPTAPEAHTGAGGAAAGRDGVQPGDAAGPVGGQTEGHRTAQGGRDRHGTEGTVGPKTGRGTLGRALLRTANGTRSVLTLLLLPQIH